MPGAEIKSKDGLIGQGEDDPDVDSAGRRGDSRSRDCAEIDAAR
jgi:hypothetical protein